MLSKKQLKFSAYAALFAIGGLICTGLSPLANAQSEPVGLIPSTGATVEVDSTFSSDEITHPPLRLTPDKSTIVDLDEPAERIIIGSELHINVLMDSTTRMIAVPRIPGATHFTILGENGKVLMQRHVIVASPKEKYVRIRETCINADTCQPMRMFYCPDMCHEIAIVESVEGESANLSATSGGGGDGGTEETGSGDGGGSDN